MAARASILAKHPVYGGKNWAPPCQDLPSINVLLCFLLIKIMLLWSPSAWDGVGRPDLCRTYTGDAISLSEITLPRTGSNCDWGRGSFLPASPPRALHPMLLLLLTSSLSREFGGTSLHYIQAFLFDWGYLTYQDSHTEAYILIYRFTKKSLIVNCASWTNKSEINFAHFQYPNTKPDAQTEVNVSGVKRLLRVQLWRMWRHR